MPKSLTREDRLRLMKFVCSFAWADLEIQDEERQRLGRELHDCVSSLLTSAAIHTSSLAGQLKEGNSIRPEDLDEATEQIQEAADQARAISHGLRPVGVEQGIASALEKLVSQTEVRGDLEFTYVCGRTRTVLSFSRSRTTARDIPRRQRMMKG